MRHDDETTHRAWRIRGRVQGVGFRYATREEARSLDVRGWVRNEADGSVRVEVEGPPGSVETFFRWCHDGPARARVEHVDTLDVVASGPLPYPFDVRR